MEDERYAPDDRPLARRLFRRRRFWRSEEVVFEARIDYADSDASLTEEDDRVEAAVYRALTAELPRDLSRFFGLEVSTRIRGTRYGSLSVFFSVFVLGYTVLSGYKGLFDSVELIRSQADELIESALRGRNQRFSVNVYARYPQFSQRRWADRLLSSDEFPIAIGPPARSSLRGAFALLLLVAIIEALAIALLVYGAVMKTYF